MGRPLYDFGMLDLAKVYLKRVIARLSPLIRAGVPVVGLEPSCLTVFRDELRNLLPHDLDGMKLSQQSYLLSEFLEREAKHLELPKLKRKAMVQGHCHHKSVLKMDAEKALFNRVGLDAEILDSGCCGMAGSFGFEKAGGAL